MKTPERCPWCGAEENIRPDGVRTGTYICEASLLGRGLWGNMAKAHAMCRFGALPFAVEYRQTLAWRKRLSQHTGVPLRMVPDPDSFDVRAAYWEGKLIMSVQRHKGVFLLCLGSSIVATSAAAESPQKWKAEARRRLLAKGE